MAELDKSLFSAGTEATQVEVDMLDFHYVEECSDWKKLFAILELLQSGKEGHYPELAQSTEEKMLAIMPEKERKRYLALKSTASSDEIALATADIQKWQVSTRSIDTQLKAGEFKNEFKSDNLRTEELFPLINKSQREKILDAGKKMKSDEMSHFQRERRAELERRKGNESFKASEYDASIRFYTISIALNPSNDSVWANRAIAYIKIKLFDLAEQDCDVCLKINSSNVKALARRGFARFSQGKYRAAAIDYIAAIKIDPINEEYPKFLAKSKEMYAATEGKELLLTDETPTQQMPTAIPSAPKPALNVVHVASTSSWTSVNCTSEKGMSQLIIPGESMKLLYTGSLLNSEVLDEHFEESYVKIPVSIVDDDDEGSDEEVQSEIGHEKTSSFVRIAIQEDSDEETEEPFLTEMEIAAGITTATPDSEKAIALKDYGNKVMLAAEWSKAISAYSRSLEINFSVATLNNRAQAKLSSQDYLGTIEDTTQVLAKEHTNVKALYRRAKAHFGLGQFSLCKIDLENLLNTEPTNEPATKMLVAVSASLETEIVKQKKDQAEALKVQGNNAFQTGDIQNAIQLYTDALTLDPENLSIINNRALAHLKSSMWAETIADSSKVIDGTVADDEQKIGILRKALLRRAEARYKQSPTEEKALEEALADTERAAAFGDSGVIVNNDLSRSINESLDILRAQKKVCDKPSRSSDVGSVPSSPASAKTADTPPTAEKTLPKTPKTPSSASRSKVELKLELPSAPAKTLYEFERTWRGFSGRDDLRVAYLRLFKSSNFKKVFKAAISDDLLASIFAVLEGNEAESNLCLKVLESLKQMNSFALTIRMLPQDALSALGNIFQRLLSLGEDDETTEKIRMLKVDYSL